MLDPLATSRRAIAAGRRLISRLSGGRLSPEARASHALPPDPFGLAPEPPSPETQATRRAIENTIPRNFAGG